MTLLHIVNFDIKNISFRIDLKRFRYENKIYELRKNLRLKKFRRCNCVSRFKIHIKCFNR